MRPGCVCRSQCRNPHPRSPGPFQLPPRPPSPLPKVGLWGRRSPAPCYPEHPPAVWEDRASQKQVLSDGQGQLVTTPAPAGLGADTPCASSAPAQDGPDDPDSSSTPGALQLSSWLCSPTNAGTGREPHTTEVRRWGMGTGVSTAWTMNGMLHQLNEQERDEQGLAPWKHSDAWEQRGLRVPRSCSNGRCSPQLGNLWLLI